MKMTRHILTNDKYCYEKHACRCAVIVLLAVARVAAAQDMGAFEQSARQPARPFALLVHAEGTGAVVGRVAEVSDLFAIQAGMPGTGLGSAVGIAISPEALADVRDAQGGIELKNVPVGGGRQENFLIEPFDVFTEGAEVLAFDGRTHTPIERPAVVLYRGSGLTDPSSDIFLSITNDDEVWMLVRSDRKAAYVCPTTRQPGPKRHMLVERESLAGPRSGTFCSADRLPENSAAVDRFLALPEAPMAALDSPVHAEIMVDVNHGLLANEFAGDADAATTYAANLFAASSAIYQRDAAICLRISHMVVWTDADPFGAYDSEGQLNAYTAYCQQNRGGVQRDLAHLLADLDGAGGIAWIDALCDTSLGYAVSNLEMDATFPVQGYAWDINCITHEMGHNFGSPHTHCYDPPIDCCYADECGCPQQDQLGTVMSYCHLGALGTDMHFHPRVIEVLRAGTMSAACLTPGCGDEVECGNNICEVGEDETTCPTDCSGCEDTDDDGVCDQDDNCPDVPNADQTDSNGNRIGDACDHADDGYEENDTPEQAATIQLGAFQLQGSDDDWFRFSVAEAAEVVVEISGPSGDLDLGLFDHDGNLLGQSAEWESVESLWLAVDTGDFYLLIQPYNGMASSYTLTLDLADPEDADGNSDTDDWDTDDDDWDTDDDDWDTDDDDWDTDDDDWDNDDDDWGIDGGDWDFDGALPCGLGMPGGVAGALLGLVGLVPFRRRRP